MQNSIMNENKQNYYFFFISSRVKLNCYDIWLQALFWWFVPEVAHGAEV